MHNNCGAFNLGSCDCLLFNSMNCYPVWEVSSYLAKTHTHAHIRQILKVEFLYTVGQWPLTIYHRTICYSIISSSNCAAVQTIYVHINAKNSLISYSFDIRLHSAMKIEFCWLHGFDGLRLEWVSSVPTNISCVDWICVHIKSVKRSGGHRFVYWMRRPAYMTYRYTVNGFIWNEKR